MTVGIDSRTFNHQGYYTLRLPPSLISLLTEQSAVTGMLVAMAAATFTVVVEKPFLWKQSSGIAAAEWLHYEVLVCSAKLHVPSARLLLSREIVTFNVY